MFNAFPVRSADEQRGTIRRFNGQHHSAPTAGAAAEHDASLRPLWVTFMARWTDLHFLYGERAVPGAREHHRPTDGARYHSTTDYFHSAWIDPLIRYWAGIRIQDDLKTVVFDPYTEEAFSLRRVPVLGEELSFEQSIDDDGRRHRSIRNRQGKVLIESAGTEHLKLTIPDRGSLTMRP